MHSKTTVYYHRCTIFWDPKGENKKNIPRPVSFKKWKASSTDISQECKDANIPFQQTVFKVISCQAREPNLLMTWISPFFLSTGTFCCCMLCCEVGTNLDRGPRIFTYLKAFILSFSSGRLMGFIFTFMVLRGI